MEAERVSGACSGHPTYRIFCINSYLQLSDVLQSLTVSCLFLTTLHCAFLQSSQLVHCYWVRHSLPSSLRRICGRLLGCSRMICEGKLCRISQLHPKVCMATYTLLSVGATSTGSAIFTDPSRWPTRGHVFS